jgi:hypothetical protein
MTGTTDPWILAIPSMIGSICGTVVSRSMGIIWTTLSMFNAKAWPFKRKTSREQVL